MAITAAALQSALVSATANGIKAARVLRSYEPSQGSTQQWLVRGGTSAMGRTLKVVTTASDNAATQATSVLTALRA